MKTVVVETESLNGGYRQFQVLCHGLVSTTKSGVVGSQLRPDKDAADVVLGAMSRPRRPVYDRDDLLVALAAEQGLAVVATTAAHYAHPARGRLAAAMAAVLGVPVVAVRMQIECPAMQRSMVCIRLCLRCHRSAT
ncbi:MAG TPA: hypothetical protein VFZ92_07275 [Umezawaea sp.]